MKRLVGALLFCASTALGQSNGWQEIQNGWGEIQTATGGSSTPATCLVAGQVPFLLSPTTLGLGCDAGLTYDAATDTLYAGELIVASGGRARNSMDSWSAGYAAGSRDYGLHLANFAQLTWAAGTGASGVADLGLIRSTAGWGKVTNGSSGDGGWIMQGLQLVTGSRPTCDAAARGMTWYVAGGAGAADTIEICGKAAANTYSWVALATF